LKMQDVLDTVEAAYSGAIVGQTFSGARTVSVVVRLPDEMRGRLDRVGQLMISGPYGPVPLSQVARLDLSADRYSIEHEGGQRRIAVTFNVEGRSLQSVVAEAQRRISQSVRLPPGTFIEFTGAAAAERRTRIELLAYSGAALALIVMILLVALHWPASGWLVMANLPFSLLGSVLAVAVTGIGLSLGSLVGLVTVFGISARNAILQLAHYEHMVEREAMNWSLELVLRGANERLVPILMTAVVTALGLAPLAAGIHSPGQEIEAPMAITVLGGLVSSTVLNLIVLPALAHRYGGPKPQPASRIGVSHV
jgi:Cu/Ag efflux pump CusA